MGEVDLRKAKGRLGRLIEKAIQGEEVIITRGGKPVVKLVPLEKTYPSRRLGTAAGQVWLSEDFDDLIPEFEIPCSDPS